MKKEIMGTLYDDIIEGLEETLNDIKKCGEPQGRKTIIEYKDNAIIKIVHSPEKKNQPSSIPDE